MCVFIFPHFVTFQGCTVGQLNPCLRETPLKQDAVTTMFDSGDEECVDESDVQGFAFWLKGSTLV